MQMQYAENNRAVLKNRGNKSICGIMIVERPYNNCGENLLYYKITIFIKQ